MKFHKKLFAAFSLITIIFIFLTSCADAVFYTASPTDSPAASISPSTIYTYSPTTNTPAKTPVTTTKPPYTTFTPTTTKPIYTTIFPTTIKPAYTTIAPTATTPAFTTTVPPTTTSGIYAKVLRVIDGDTIEILINNITFTVRYIGIDTPETVDPDKPIEPYGLEATNINKELVEGKTVFLEKDVTETDIYGRLLRYVYADGIFVNAEMVRLGYAEASPFPPDVKYQEVFLQLQQEAKESCRGLWATVYITKTGNKYHLYGCSGLSKSCIPISRADAIAQGYEPCNICKP